MATKKTAKATKNAKAAPTKAKAAPAKKKTPVRAKPETLRLRSAAPGLTVNDLQKSLAWYRDVLGFVIGEKWEHEGKLMGAEVKAGTVGFMLGQDDWKKGRDRKKGEGFRLYCTTTQDVDALAKRIVGKGGTLDQEPRDQSWGMRDFAFTDPDGFKITIGAEKKKR